ncbi:hypothetical protein NE237_027666 [Protea cynaroides]|uniref:Uncharacterized protein n=1 Tax=Protea cynaroides TaxID=273540 RepID=A0A9Q0GNZ2_9MAGN|nr:hypothetical protein NE237_027666 [Protea cynaroides]
MGKDDKDQGSQEAKKVGNDLEIIGQEEAQVINSSLEGKLKENDKAGEWKKKRKNNPRTRVKKMKVSGLDEQLKQVEEPMHVSPSCNKPEDLVNAAPVVGSSRTDSIPSNPKPNLAPTVTIISSHFEVPTSLSDDLDPPSGDVLFSGSTRLEAPGIGKSQLAVRYIFDPREDALSPLSIEPVPLATKPAPRYSGRESDNSCLEG